MRNRKDKIFALVAAGCLCLSGLTGCGEIKMSPDNISSKSDDGLMGSVKEETDASDESEADAAGEEDKVSNDMIGRYEMDSVIEGRLARERQKYADYDDLKEKAGKYDEYQAQNKTELQKEKEKSDALQAKLSALEKKDTVRQVREKTAKDTGVPVELLTGEDEETCKKQAEAIMKFAKPKSYPGTKGNRKKTTEYNTTDDAMREFAHQIFGKGE